MQSADPASQGLGQRPAAQTRHKSVLLSVQAVPMVALRKYLQRCAVGEPRDAPCSARMLFELLLWIFQLLCLSGVTVIVKLIILIRAWRHAE